MKSKTPDFFKKDHEIGEPELQRNAPPDTRIDSNLMNPETVEEEQWPNRTIKDIDKFFPIEELAKPQDETDESPASLEDQILEKVDRDMDKQRKVLKAERLEKERRGSLMMEQKEKERKLRETLKEKHGFTSVEFGNLIRNREKFSNFFIVSLIEYLEYQGETEFSFNKMSKFKKEGNKKYYKIEKENWEELKKNLSSYQLDEKEMTERTPEKITIDEESEAPYFIRKHNLDALNWEHRQILMKFLKVENEKREAWSKTEALKKKKAA